LVVSAADAGKDPSPVVREAAQEAIDKLEDDDDDEPAKKKAAPKP
jgi:hypothetical protein